MNFQQQAERFIQTAQTRRRNPIGTATVAKYEAALNTHIFPLLGNKDLSEVNNNALKVLVAKMSAEGLAATTISSVVSVVKLVVASAVDEQGAETHPRTWNHEFIDLPIIDPTAMKTPVMGAEAVSQAISRAKGQDKALCALLAGTGLRIGEAQALFVGPQNSVNSTWNPQTATIYVHTTVVNETEIQAATKTKAGTRQVDLSPELNAFLVDVLKPVTGSRMFSSPDGGVVCRMTLKNHMPTIPGFHSLRRFRVTHLEAVNVPPGLQRFWTGHAAGDVHETYIKMGEQIQTRKEWAAKAGLGFSL